MNTPLPPGFDLSKLPEPIRAKLQAQLDRLSPEMRQQLIERGSPILQKAIDRAKDASTPSTRTLAVTPVSLHGQFIRTVMPGDRMQLPLSMVALVIAAVVALYYLYG